MSWSYPLWRFKVGYEVLRDAPSYPEQQKLLAFFNAHAGRYQEFFFFDPSDNTATAQQFGVGNGVTTTFQLVRTLGAGAMAFVEPVRGVVYTPTLTKTTIADGTVVIDPSAYTIGPLGTVNFTTPPATGAVLKWTGNFMFLVRFDQDEMDVQQMMQGLWSQSGIDLVTVKS